jgi:CubicO group peptidase (beta-lactamase class C family)
MRTRSRILSVSVACAAVLWASAQAIAQVVSPESVGLSSDRLTRIDALMQSHIDAGGFAGAVTLVARDNKIAWFHTQGVMDIESGRPMQRDAVFRIMSMTKPVVAFSIMMMIEEGKVRLTDPASKFIPELEGLRVAVPSTPNGVEASREIQVLDLLTHSSGLMSGPESNAAVSIDFGPDATLANVLPQLAAAPLEFQPGTRWAYSPMYGFDVLARIVEVTSGVDFGTFVEQRIFRPLDMNDTFFYRDEPHPNTVKLYRNADGELVENPDMPFVNGRYFSGGGGLFSSAEDYLQFALVLLNDGKLGGTRLLGRRTMEIMRSAFLPDDLPGRSPGEGYGLGVRVITDAAASRTWLSNGSFGWSGAFNTHFFVDPRERIVGIYMTQITGFRGSFTLMDDFETAVMQAVID